MDDTLPCYGFQVPVDEVLEAVYTVVRQQLLAVVPTNTDGKQCLTLASVNQQQFEEQIAEIMDSKRLLYEQFVAGEIDAQSFKGQKSVLDERLSQTKSTFAAMRAKADEVQNIDERKQQRQMLLDEIRAAGTLSNELAERIIDHINVYPDKRIDIVYKIADLLE